MNQKEFIEKIKSAKIERDEEKKIYIAALFTAGHYTTADIDIVAKKPSEVKQVLKDLGFKSITGTRFVNEGLGVIIDYMGENPIAERIDRIKIKGLEVETISIEEVLISKLRMLEKGVDAEKSNAQVKVIAYLLEERLNKKYLMGKLVKENLWELWLRIKAEVDEYGPKR